MPDEEVLTYIKNLRQDIQHYLIGWRASEHHRLSGLGDELTDKDFTELSHILENHPLQSLVNKLWSDHENISKGCKIKPPGLDEFMPNHYSISFPITGNTLSAQTLFNKTMAAIAGIAGINSSGVNPFTSVKYIDMATNPDQSGYARVRVDESGKPSFEPITKEEFYKKTDCETDRSDGFNIHTEEDARMSAEQIKEFSDKCHEKEMESLGYNIAGETDSFEKNVAFMKKIERDKAMLAAQIADDFNIKIEDDMADAEQKIKDGIIERGGE